MENYMKNLSPIASRLSSFSFAMLIGASLASVSVAADNEILTGNYFDDNGAYFGPSCEKDGTQSTGAFYTGDYTSPFKTFLGKTDKDIQNRKIVLSNFVHKTGPLRIALFFY